MNRKARDARNSTIARMAQFDHMNLREIGEHFDLTREGVRMILLQQGVDYPMTVERRRNLGSVSQANPFAARINPITVIQSGPRKGKRTPEYVVYSGMLERCDNPKATHYARYGGRGITVCDRWRGEFGYETFLVDMGQRPPGVYANGRAKLSIHRKDNDGPYTKENCKWATQKEQCANQRPRVRKAKPTATPESADVTVSGCLEVDNEEECTVYREDIGAGIPVSGFAIGIPALPTADGLAIKATEPMPEALSTAA